MTMEKQAMSQQLHFTQPLTEYQKEVVSDEAIQFLSSLVSKFAPRVKSLLEAREARQQEINDGQLPDFLPETQAIRDGDWTIRGIPADLQDRRLEITGPVERKMVINALNANVKVFMADFEDSFAPAWDATIDGQINLRDAINGTIEYTNPGNGKEYRLNEDPAVLICRVRGLHLPEKHVLFNGEAIPGSLFDFALYFVNNYKNLLKKGSGPYFYLPKLQAHQEAAWWSDVFSFAEDEFGLARGTIKATVLIETLPAVFEMNEILHSLKDHIVALNCGRWDYIFSYIKTLRNYPDRILPDRQVVTMDKPFLNAYSRLLIRTCHRRGALAMGGMSASSLPRIRKKMPGYWTKSKRISSSKPTTDMTVPGWLTPASQTRPVRYLTWRLVKSPTSLISAVSRTHLLLQRSCWLPVKATVPKMECAITFGWRSNTSKHGFQGTVAYRFTA